MEKNKHCINEQAKIFKALGHPSRLFMLVALRDGERCVCDLRSLIGDDMSTISKHLSVLREAGVVTSQKRGTSIYYRLSFDCFEQLLNATEEFVQNRVMAQAELLQKGT